MVGGRDYGVRHADIEHRGYGLSVEELVQAGLQALLAAGGSFDPEEHGPSFAAHARRAVRSRIRDAISVD